MTLSRTSRKRYIGDLPYVPTLSDLKLQFSHQVIALDLPMYRGRLKGHDVLNLAHATGSTALDSVGCHSLFAVH